MKPFWSQKCRRNHTLGTGSKVQHVYCAVGPKRGPQECSGAGRHRRRTRSDRAAALDLSLFRKPPPVAPQLRAGLARVGTSEIVDSNQYPIAIKTSPPNEVRLLRALTFDKYKKFKADSRARHALPGRTSLARTVQLRSPEVMKSAAASNSWRDRMGVAPYLPAR